MMGKSCVDVLRDVTGDNSIQTIPEGLQVALSGGGGGGILVVHANESGVLDKTWQEIYDAGFCVCEGTDGTSKGYHIILGIGHEENEYFVTFANQEATSGTTEFLTDSADGYPVINQNGGDISGGGGT